MIKPVLTSLLLFATVHIQAATASAANIINYPMNGVDGSCVFNTVCGATEGALHPFAAQSFKLTSATVLTHASFTAYIGDILKPFAINWRILSANIDGLPGATVARDRSTDLDQTYLGEQFGFSIIRSSFGMANTKLDAGDYYLAIQAVTQAHDIFLATADGSGGAYTEDGERWTSGYATGSAIAISLAGDSVTAVPEAATWAMMITGFALVGTAFRRRDNVRTRAIIDHP